MCPSAGDEDDEDDGREVWPSPPKPRERRMVIEVFDPESPDGETMSPNARAICAGESTPDESTPGTERDTEQH